MLAASNGTTLQHDADGLRALASTEDDASDTVAHSRRVAKHSYERQRRSTTCLVRHSVERCNDTRAPRQLAPIRPYGRRSAGHTDIQKEKTVL